MIVRMGRVRQSRKDLPKRLYHYHGTYYFIEKSGRRYNLGKDYPVALRQYAELVQVSQDAPRQRLGDVMTTYVTTCLGDLKERTRADYMDAISRLRPVFGGMWPEDLEPKHIYAYMDKRGAPVRANREVAVLSNVMNLAIRKGLISANPCKQVKRHKEKAEGKTVTDEQIVAFKAICPDWLQVYIDLKLLIGLRQGDMLKLTMFNARDDGLYCLTGKANKPLLFSWTTALRDVIERAKSIRRRPSDARLFARTQNTFKGAWQYYANQLGELRFAEKDIRSRVACDAVDMGRDATTLLAHSTDAVTRRHYLRGARKVAPLR